MRILRMVLIVLSVLGTLMLIALTAQQQIAMGNQ